MKKAIYFLVSVLFLSFVARSQSDDTIFNDYFLPDFIDIDSCVSTNFLNLENSFYNYINIEYCCFVTTGVFYYNDYQSYVFDRAQPCYTDTLLRIQGIAVGVNYLFYPMNNIEQPISQEHFPSFQKVEAICPISQVIQGEETEIQANILKENYNNIEKGKLKIMNHTLEEEIASLKIDTNFNITASSDYSYLEFYFDSLVNVNELFYIVEDVEPNSTRILNMVFIKDCPYEYHSLVRGCTGTASVDWVQWNDHPFSHIDVDEYSLTSSYTYADYEEYYWEEYAKIEVMPIPNTCQMFMFPIFAETNIADTNVCLYDVNVDRYSNVYPNPASDIVTVQSSFKIREIEIHNALGQVVLRKQGSQNIETIDVSNLQSGAYIVRIKTQKGFANKKILIE